MKCGCDNNDKMYMVVSFDNGETAEVIETCNNPDHWESNVIVITLDSGGRVTFDKSKADQTAASYNALS